LAISNLGIRLVFAYIVVPFYNIFFFKKSSDGSKDPLLSFDAEHFDYISKFWYTHEKNHAFFPGFPYILSKIPFSGFTFNLILGCLNTVLLYHLGPRLFQSKSQRSKDISFVAALLMTFS
jgi:hypothetical protein